MNLYNLNFHKSIENEEIPQAIRIAMYIVSGVIMKGKVPSYASITPDELNSRFYFTKILFVLPFIQRVSI